MGDPRQGSTDAGVRGAVGSSTVAGPDTETFVSVGERSAGPFKPSIELLVDTALADADVGVDGTTSRCWEFSFAALLEHPLIQRMTAITRPAAIRRMELFTSGSSLKPQTSSSRFTPLGEANYPLTIARDRFTTPVASPKNFANERPVSSTFLGLKPPP